MAEISLNASSKFCYKKTSVQASHFMLTTGPGSTPKNLITGTMIARYWILVTFLDKEDEDDMLSHPGLSRILGFRPYSLIGRRSVGGLPMLARASLRSPKPGKRPTFDRTFSRSHGLGPHDPSPGVLLNSLPPHWPTSPSGLVMIRGIIHQKGVNRIGTSSQESSLVRIVLIQVRFLVVGRPEDFTHQLRDFYYRCIPGLFLSLIWNAAFEIAQYLQFCIPHICKLTCGLATYVCARVVFITLRDEEESKGEGLLLMVTISNFCQNCI